jgi:signal transduction histidine kinase
LETLLQADSTKFIKNTSPLEVNYGFDQRNGWCKFHIRNISDHKDWILKIQQSRVDTVQLYIVRENNNPENLGLTGHFQTISERPVLSLPFAYPILINKNETITLYLYTQRQYGRHAAIVNLQRKDYFEKYEYAFNVCLGVVCGMVLLAALIGFFLYLFVRQKVYVYYSVYALSFFLLLMADTGFAIGTISFTNYQTEANGFTVAFYYWMGAWHMLFTIALLRINRHGKRWLLWLGLGMVYCFILATFLLLIPSLPSVIRSSLVMFCYYIIFIANGYIFYAVIRSTFKTEPVVYLYMAGFYFTLFMGTLLILSDFQVLYISNQYKDLFYLTPLIEILCVVLGIGIHFSRTLKERIDVQLALNKTQDQIITIQEDERRRIAQDLHDDVGNSLAAVRNMVVLKKEPAEVEKEINNVINTIRTISHNLMPVDFNEFSLVEIIAHLVNKHKDHPSIALEFDCGGQPLKINPLTELVIYRIINELIINIFKHSQAKKAFIQLMYQKESLVVTVEDDGVGIKNISKTEEGIGLRSIRLRAAYIRASFNVESDDKGTLIILEIPYEKA